MIAPVCPVFMLGRLVAGCRRADEVLENLPHERSTQNDARCLGSDCAFWDPDPENRTLLPHQARGRCGMARGARNFPDPAAPPAPPPSGDDLVDQDGFIDLDVLAGAVGRETAAKIDDDMAEPTVDVEDDSDDLPPIAKYGASFVPVDQEVGPIESIRRTPRPGDAIAFDGRTERATVVRVDGADVHTSIGVIARWGLLHWDGQQWVEKAFSDGEIPF